MAEVGDCCGATTGCGGCYELVAEIVAVEKRRLVMADGAELSRRGPGLEQALPVETDLQLTG